MKKEDISQLRREYNAGSFTEKNTAKSPFDQFQKWFDDAKEVGVLDPTAMTVSTVSREGMPSSRVVLLKSFDEDGFVFFTNYEGRKGTDLSTNPKASILFFWDQLERQIRIEGEVHKITPEESEAYFVTRSYTSKVGAWASKQSRELSSRYKLLREVAIVMAKHPVNVPLPPFWGGYRLVPSYFEYWQGRESRLHDRITYEKHSDGWDIKRLYP